MKGANSPNDLSAAHNLFGAHPFANNSALLRGGPQNQGAAVPFHPMFNIPRSGGAGGMNDFNFAEFAKMASAKAAAVGGGHTVTPLPPPLPPPSSVNAHHQSGTPPGMQKGSGAGAYNMKTSAFSVVGGDHRRSPPGGAPQLEYDLHTKPNNQMKMKYASNNPPYHHYANSEQQQSLNNSKSGGGYNDRKESNSSGRKQSNNNNHNNSSNRQQSNSPPTNASSNGGKSGNQNGGGDSTSSSSSSSKNGGNQNSSNSKPELNPACQPRCSSEELAKVDAKLETKELWEKFHELGTEMIITKTGRR